MSFKLQCPNCQQKLEADEEMIGMTLECPTCGKPFTVKGEQEKKAQLKIVNTNDKRQLSKKTKFSLLVILFCVIAIACTIYGFKGKKELESQPSQVSQITLPNVTLHETDGNYIVMLKQGVEIKLVKIQAGSFQMGGRGEKNASHVHIVKITKDFWMSAYEVTQEQYMTVMNNNPSFYNMGGKYPVEQVSWEDAMSFCRKLTEQVHLAGCLKGLEFTLPTEAQWEYACRAGTTTAYYLGNDITQYNANFFEFSGNEDPRIDIERMAKKRTTEVGSYRPNQWGLYDMHGNVREWCLDGMRNYQNRVEENPIGPMNSQQRVCRGGSRLDLPRNCRSACRMSFDSELRSDLCGFRLALVSVQRNESVREDGSKNKGI